MTVYEKYIVHEYSIWKVQSIIHEKYMNKYSTCKRKEYESITGKQYMKIVHEQYMNTVYEIST